jgi:hypothetical protein
MTLKMNESRSEADLEKVLRQMEEKYKGITFDIKVAERKLVPLQIVLDVTIQVVTGLAAAAFIKFLERLWEELKEKELDPQTYEIDAIQSFSERYLKSIGVTEFTILERKDRGPYVQFVFEDKKGYRHFIVVASFDLKILKYEKKEGV